MGICLCGCGKEVTRKGSKYKSGHLRKMIDNLPDKFCECGCGNLVRKRNRYIHGHNKSNLGIIHSKEFCEKQSIIKKGKKFTEEQKAERRRKMAERGTNISPTKGKTTSKETKRKQSEAHKGKPSHNKGIRMTEKQKVKISKTLKIRYLDPYVVLQHSEARIGHVAWNKGIPCREETKQKLSEKHKGKQGSRKGSHHKKESIVLISENSKRLWQDPEYVAKQIKSRNVKQNKTEKIFEEILFGLFNNEYKFVGDGQVIINGKNPDFININGQKKIIELFGNYWHKGNDPQDRINIFKPYGYETLVVWEKELRNIGSLKERLIKFHNKYNPYTECKL